MLAAKSVRILTLFVMFTAYLFLPVQAMEQKDSPETEIFICGPYSLEVPEEYETGVYNSKYYSTIVINSMLWRKKESNKGYRIPKAWVSCVRTESPPSRHGDASGYTLSSMNTIHMETGSKSGMEMFVQSSSDALCNGLSCMQYILMPKYSSSSNADSASGRLNAVFAYEFSPLPEDNYQTLIFINPHVPVDLTASDKILSQAGNARYEIAQKIMQTIRVQQ